MTFATHNPQLVEPSDVPEGFRMCSIAEIPKPPQRVLFRDGKRGGVECWTERLPRNHGKPLYNELTYITPDL